MLPSIKSPKPTAVGACSSAVAVHGVNTARLSFVRQAHSRSSMKRIPNLQFKSTEADRKVMLWVSIALMVLFWVMTAVMCLWFWHRILTEVGDIVHFPLAILMTVLDVLLIPFQLVRYVQELRQLRASK